MTRRIGRADQAEQPVILHRSIGERVPYLLIEPAARDVEETTHDGRIKLATICLDKGVLRSDVLRSVTIAHRSSPGSNDHRKVSVKPWEVHPRALRGLTPLLAVIPVALIG